MHGQTQIMFKGFDICTLEGGLREASMLQRIILWLTR